MRVERAIFFDRQTYLYMFGSREIFFLKMTSEPTNPRAEKKTVSVVNDKI